MKQKIFVLIVLLMTTLGNVWAYDFSVKNEDGVAIYYHIIDGGVEVSGGHSGKSCIKIPESVSYNGNDYAVIAIREKAFYFYTNLKTIDIPCSVKSIGYEAFSASGLESISFPKSITSIRSGTFYDCKSLTSVEIPSSVTTIMENAFHGCEQLTSIELPNSITFIDRGAFSECYNLASVKLPNAVTSIERSTFYGCKFSSIEIPESVTSINEYAFMKCDRLVSFSIPHNVSYIGWDAFNGCTNMKSLTVNIESPNGITLYNDAFRNLPTETCILHVPLGSKELYANADLWKDFANIVEIIPCAAPVITIQDNQLLVTCETEDAKIHTSITSDDFNNFENNSGEAIPLTGQYLVTSYATADGYEQSEPATAVLVWSKVIDVESGIDAIEMGTERALLLRSIGENIEIVGTAADETICVYNISGQQFYTGKSTVDRTIIPVALNKGEIYIIKVGEQSIKYQF